MRARVMATILSSDEVRAAIANGFLPAHFP